MSVPTRHRAPLRGRIRVVPDKSLTHRGALLAAVCEGRTSLSDPNPGEDCARTLAAVEALGAAVERSCDAWRIEARPLREPEDVLDLGNSGTGMRLIAGLLAARPFLSILTGDASLRGRPMDRIAVPLSRMGARIEGRAGMRAPLVIRGGDLHGVEIDLPVASAQVKSALLLAGLGLDEGRVRLREPAASRDHTERLLEWLGAPLRRDRGWIELDAGARLAARDWRVPGDISAAIFFCVAAAITPGSEVVIEHVGLNPTRTGALEALARMGARIEVEPDAASGPEPTGSLRIVASELTPVEIGGAEVPRLIDEVPVLAVAAAFALGTSRFADLGELRVKESDRIRSTCALLRSLGAAVEEEGDGFVVEGRGELRGGAVRSWDDHRVAMAALVAGCASSEEVAVDSLAMVATSDPGFTERLGRLREGGA